MRIRLHNGVGMGTNNYILGENDGIVLIDCSKGISSRLKHLGINPADVKAILYTHGHFDHIDGDAEIPSSVPRYGAEKERELFREPSLNLSRMTGNVLSIQPDHFFKDGDIIETPVGSFLVMETPGHTKGSVCFRHIGKPVIFTGDTLFELSIGRTDFPGGSMEDMNESLRKLALLSEDVIAYPGHGSATTIGREKAHNSYMRAAEAKR